MDHRDNERNEALQGKVARLRQIIREAVPVEDPRPAANAEIPAITNDFTAIHVAQVYSDGYVLDLGISGSNFGAGVMSDPADNACHWATAVLELAQMRGDDDSDRPGTYDDAVRAAHFIMQMATGFRAAAGNLSRSEAQAARQ